MNIFIIFFTTMLLTNANCQDFKVSLNFPSIVDNNYTNIKAIGTDSQNNILFSLQNSKARRYNPNLTSYINFTLIEPASVIGGLTQNITNGITYISNSSIIYTLSDNRMTLRSYDAHTFSLLQTYTVNQTINNFRSYTFNVSGNIKTCFFIFCKSGFMIAYNSTITLQNSHFYSHIQNIYSVITQFQISPIPFFQNQLNITLSVILSQQFNTIYSIYQAVYQFLYSFSGTTQQFLLYSSMATVLNLVATMSIPGSFLLNYNNVIAVQQSTNGTWQAYNTATHSFINVTGLLNSPVNIPFFTYFGHLYLLHSTGLVQILINSTSVSLYAHSVILPNQTYSLAFGSVYNVFYAVGSPYYYLAGACIDQTTTSNTSNSTCTSYSCSSVNCKSCPFGSNICGVCNSGYYLTQILTCFVTEQSLQNIQSQIYTYFKPSENTSPLYQKIMDILAVFIQTIKTVISVPAARRVLSPLFYFFGIFDDIYFYQFQDRQYGVTMQSVFTQISEIQTQKWGVVSYTQVFDFLGLNASSLNDTIDYQSAYLTYNFTSPNHTVLGTESFLGNCQNFVFVGIPITIVGFVIGYFLFRLLFKYRISKLFRKFDFWLFILLLLFDGNVQQFSFYLSRDLTNVFMFQFSQKLIKIGVILFGFVVVLYGSSMYLLSSIVYRRLSFYFNDNNKKSLIGVFYLILQNGFKNMVIGVSQSLLRFNLYLNTISVLMVMEIMFFIIFLISINLKIYKKLTKIWIFIFLSLLKLIVIWSLCAFSKNMIYFPFEQIQKLCLLFLISIFFIGFVFDCILEMKKFIQQFICLRWIKSIKTQKKKKYTKTKDKKNINQTQQLNLIFKEQKQKQFQIRFQEISKKQNGYIE